MKSRYILTFLAHKIMFFAPHAKSFPLPWIKSDFSSVGTILYTTYHFCKAIIFMSEFMIFDSKVCIVFPSHTLDTFISYHWQAPQQNQNETLFTKIFVVYTVWTLLHFFLKIQTAFRFHFTSRVSQIKCQLCLVVLEIQNTFRKHFFPKRGVTIMNIMGTIR